jgi:hypothetical protein
MDKYASSSSHAGKLIVAFGHNIPIPSQAVFFITLALILYDNNDNPLCIMYQIKHVGLVQMDKYASSSSHWMELVHVLVMRLAE